MLYYLWLYFIWSNFKQTNSEPEETSSIGKLPGSLFILLLSNKNLVGILSIRFKMTSEHVRRFGGPSQTSTK